MKCQIYMLSEENQVTKHYIDEALKLITTSSKNWHHIIWFLC